MGKQTAVRYQQVAALDFADNPDHNFRIHAEKRPATYWIRNATTSLDSQAGLTAAARCVADSIVYSSPPISDLKASPSPT